MRLPARSTVNDSSTVQDCAVVSDLHLFSKRSRAHVHQPRILDAARRTGRIVLAGDIVDFRWSRMGSADATADAAVDWLGEILDGNDGGDVEYVLGNHDHVPELVERLEVLADQCPRFRWHPYHLRIGNAVFLHGDVSNPRMDQARLRAYRESFGAHERPSGSSHHLYEVVVALRLHVLGARFLYPRAKVVRRIARYLDEVEHEVGAGLRNVYFGHTHLALSGEEYRGLRFHNCGAPIRGLEFQILEADLS